MLIEALDPISAHRHPQGGGAFLLTQHDAAQSDKHLLGSACSGIDAIDRTGLATQS